MVCAIAPVDKGAYGALVPIALPVRVEYVNS
jgi:hypothetical protein